MKYSQEEIVNALALIKDICEEHDCLECPFGTNDSTCLLHDNCPENWCLNAPRQTTWRAILE